MPFYKEKSKESNASYYYGPDFYTLSSCEGSHQHLKVCRIYKNYQFHYEIDNTLKTPALAMDDEAYAEYNHADKEIQVKGFWFPESKRKKVDDLPPISKVSSYLDVKMI